MVTCDWNGGIPKATVAPVEPLTVDQPSIVDPDEWFEDELEVESQ